MAKFQAQNPLRHVIGAGAAHPGVEIALGRQAVLREHGPTYVLTTPLGSDREVDEAIDALKSDLEATRSAAKAFLKGKGP